MALFVAMGIVSSPRPLVVSVVAGLWRSAPPWSWPCARRPGWPLVAGAAVSAVAIT
jgi:hypothetical protein